MIFAKLKNFILSPIKINWDKFIEKGKALYAALDAYWRVARYGSRTIPEEPIPHSLVTDMNIAAEGLDYGNAVLNLWNFCRDTERNIKKFFENLVIPYIYYATSSLYSFGFLTLSTMLGTLGFCLRTFIETCIRVGTFINLLTTKTEETKPSEEQEHIYSNMAIRPVLVSASLAAGIAGLTLGSGFIAIAAVALSVLTYYGTKTALNIFFPKALPTAQKWLRRHEPLVFKKAKHHLERGFIKINSWLFGAKEANDWDKYYSNSHGEAENENKASDIKKDLPRKAWDRKASTTAEVRIKLPRAVNLILFDAETYLGELNNQNDDLGNKLFKDRYQQRKTVLEKLILILDEIVKNNINKEEKLKELDELYTANTSAFSYFGYGIGPVTALFKETQALLQENIEQRIETYRYQQIGRDKKYYANKIKQWEKYQEYIENHIQEEHYKNDNSILHGKNTDVLADGTLLNENTNAGLLGQVGLFRNESEILNYNTRAKYLEKSKVEKNNSITFLLNVNKQVDQLIAVQLAKNNTHALKNETMIQENATANTSTHVNTDLCTTANAVTLTPSMFSNRVKLRSALLDQLVINDTRFRSSISARGERVQILDAILNKAYRHF